MNYGEELKYHRQKNNLSLLQLEKMTGISNQNLSRWERDEVLPNIDFCVKLADFYGITIDELIGRDKNSSPVLDQKFNQGIINNNF